MHDLIWRAYGLWQRGTKSTRRKAARAYLEKEGALEVLTPGDPNEYPPDLLDLAFLHRALRQRRPRVVLEFGIGFSSLTMAHALRANHLESGGEPGRLFILDGEERWIENSRQKMPPELLEYCELSFCEPQVTMYQGQYCTLFETLPNVIPEFVYLDGPSQGAVTGELHGLQTKVEEPSYKGWRDPVSADLLLYESTLRKGCMIVADNRKVNVQFLLANFKRPWSTKSLYADRRHIFELRR